MKSTRAILFFGLLTLSMGFFSCSGGEGGDDEPPVNPPIDQADPPGKAAGILPENGEPCSDYEEVTTDDSRVLVAFGWNTAQLAQSYILVVFEGSAEVFRNSYNATTAQVELDRGKTYTWRVISVNDSGETNGDTFSFTTPGVPVGNFAPYAAEIAIDFDMALLEMTISWIGSDEDGDALVYDVKVFEEGQLIEEFVDFNPTALDPITIVPDTDYEVEVISKDEFGNFSISNQAVTSPDN